MLKTMRLVNWNDGQPHVLNYTAGEVNLFNSTVGEWMGDNDFESLVPLDQRDTVVKLLNRMAQQLGHLHVVYVAPETSSVTDHLKKMAGLSLIHSIVGIGNKYINVIRTVDSNIASLRLRAGLSTTRTNTDLTVDNSQDAITNESSGTSLDKRNDTGDLGANPNLLTDEFITESNRNTAEQTNTLGAVAGSVKTTGNALDNYTEVERANDIESIAKLEQTLSDYYGKWLREVERSTLVYYVD